MVVGLEIGAGGVNVRGVCFTLFVVRGVVDMDIGFLRYSRWYVVDLITAASMSIDGQEFGG